MHNGFIHHAISHHFALVSSLSQGNCGLSDSSSIWSVNSTMKCFIVCFEDLNSKRCSMGDMELRDWHPQEQQ